jgi:hypothetical protein
MLNHYRIQLEDLLDRKVALIELEAHRLKREIQEKSLRIL